MRKTFFYAGIVFLLIGLTFLIASSYMQEIKKVLVNSTSNGWEVSADLEEEKTYVIDITSSSKWRDDYTGAAPDMAQPVDVVITSPTGGETKLIAFFLARLPSSPPYKSTFPIVVEVEYVSVDSNSLLADQHSSRIRFTTKQRGNYTTRIIKQTLNWTSGPPAEMTISVEIIEDQNSRGLVIQGGVISFIIGVVVSVYGIRTAKKLKVRQRTKGKK